MKKSILFLCTAAALACGLSSCQKDQQQPGTLSATMEDLMDKESKVIYDGSAFAWQEGDLIRVGRSRSNTLGGTVGSYAASLTSSPNKATFTFTGDQGVYNDDVTNDAAYQGKYYAIYPSTLWNQFNYSGHNFSNARIRIPSVYNTDANGHLLGSPMFASSSSKQLRFKHLCGLLRIQLQKEGVSISSIKVSSASQLLSGEFFTVTLNGDVPSIQASDDVTDALNSVMLTLSSPTDLTTQKTFFIPLPAGDYTDLTIELTQPSGAKCEKTQQTGTFHIERSMYSTISLGENDLSFSDVLEGAKGGLFTINANGGQVRFSQGNLQYLAAPTATWRFADNQYDVCPINSTSANRNPSDTSTRLIDMFGWGTSGYNGAMPYNYSQDATYGPNAVLYNDNAEYDWGHNAISNGGNQPGIWRTLTSAEWLYIHTRRANAANLKALATVNGQKGIILLPDTWSSDGEPETRGVVSGSSWTDNTYTAEQWTELENQGAVFLPQNGYRTTSTSGGISFSNVGGTGARGQYWSATYQLSGSNHRYYYFEFGQTSTSQAYKANKPYEGRFVRLVHDMN